MVDFIFLQVPNPALASPRMYPFALGPMYLAAILERMGLEMGFVDLREASPTDSMVDLVPRAKGYGIGFTTPESSCAQQLARALKRRDSWCYTVAGGPHPSIMPGQCLAYFDYVIMGEADHALPRLVSQGHDKGIIRGGPDPDLDSLPFPARHLAGESAFSDTLMEGEHFLTGRGNRAALLISSRGCPYKCSFCASALTKPVRFRSAENVAAEAKELVERYEVRSWREESDNLTLNRAWLTRLCELLHPLGVRWKGHGRAGHLTEDLVEAMSDGGLIEFGMGLESADPHVLALNSKVQDVESHEAAVALLRKYGIISKVYFLMGLPGETEASLRHNMEFMQRVKPDKWTLSRFTPYPGTEVWQHPDRFGAMFHADSFADFWNFPRTSQIEYEDSSREVLDSRYRRMLQFLGSNSWRR